MSVTALYAVIVCEIGTNKASLNRELHRQRRTNTHECGLPADRHSRPFNIHRTKQTTKTKARDKKSSEGDKREVGEGLCKGRHMWHMRVSFCSVHPTAGGPLPIRGFPILQHTHTQEYRPPVLTSCVILSHPQAVHSSHPVNHGIARKRRKPSLKLSCCASLSGEKSCLNGWKFLCNFNYEYHAFTLEKL